jgi:hypothetical protein
MSWVVAVLPSIQVSLWLARRRAPSRTSKLNSRNTTEMERRSRMHLVAMPIFSLS